MLVKLSWLTSTKMQQKNVPSNPRNCEKTRSWRAWSSSTLEITWSFLPGPWIEISWLILFGNPNNMELFNTDPNQIGMGDLVHLMLCLFCFQQKTVGWKFVSPCVSSFLDLWSLKRVDFSHGYVGLGRSRYRATPLLVVTGRVECPTWFSSKNNSGWK